MSSLMIQRAKELGVVNLLALRGGESNLPLLLPTSPLILVALSSCLRTPTHADPPRGEEYWVAASDEFQHATDLVKYIREHHGNDFCIGVAGELFVLLPPRSSPLRPSLASSLEYAGTTHDQGALLTHPAPPNNRLPRRPRRFRG